MRQVDWNGNDGRCNPAPGTLEAAECGICGAQMNVQRDVFGPTSAVEAMAGKKHKHDSFICPFIGKRWHEEIYYLKEWALKAEINNLPGKDEIKKTAEQKIIKILELNAA